MPYMVRAVAADKNTCGSVVGRGWDSAPDTEAPPIQERALAWGEPLACGGKAEVGTPR
ncbi:hypothetical protein T484DRAFT_1968988 [Baffinella frigidus]|nr:hypothetical protein T484DRAFT_1968988 [Cryptophyta sp. CCMP2293]